MSAPNLSRAQELAMALRAELDRLARATPTDAELRAAHELAVQIGPRLDAAARGIVEAPSPDARERRAERGIFVPPVPDALEPDRT